LIPKEKFDIVRSAVNHLIGVQLELLRIPKLALLAFEPSQIGTIVGALMDACIPQLELLLPDNELLSRIGLSKAPGLLGDREGYPDYQHSSGARLELKLLYVNPQVDVMKKIATRREASARLTQKVTVKNVQPDNDLLMVVVYRLDALPEEPEIFSPVILDVGLFPVDECVAARDDRLVRRGGRWFGDYETPAVLSKVGKAKVRRGEPLDTSTYGRKESEGRDFNEDTNFGKLKRIPYLPLQEFLMTHGATYASTGTYPKPWKLLGPNRIATPTEDEVAESLEEE
jgi:hypothetical protein